MSETLDFELVVPLTGIGPVSIAFQDPPGGAYKVEVAGAKKVVNEKEGGKTTIHFQVIIIEDGDTKGFPTTIFQGTDWEKGHNFNAKLVYNMLSGMGYPAEKLTGNLRLLPADLIGKTAYIMVKPAPEGEVDEQGRKRFANKNFITREEYEQVKRMTALAAQVMKSAPAANSPTPVVRTLGAAPAPAPAPVHVPAPAGPAVVDLSSMFPS